MNNQSTGITSNASTGGYSNGSIYDYLYKLIIIGDSGVGKSCLVHRFADGTFSDDYISTIGIDFKNKTVALDGKHIKLQMWDTAGLERFRSVTSAHYRGAVGVCLVYDVTNKQSFNHLEYWHDKINNYANSNVCVLLVGNKCDLEDKREVDFKEANAFARHHGMQYIETSAKSDNNVEQAFITLVATITERNYTPLHTGQTGHIGPGLGPGSNNPTKCICF